jgi:hypothetical protein
MNDLSTLSASRTRSINVECETHIYSIIALLLLLYFYDVSVLVFSLSKVHTLKHEVMKCTECCLGLYLYYTSSLLNCIVMKKILFL